MQTRLALESRVLEAYPVQVYRWWMEMLTAEVAPPTSNQACEGRQAFRGREGDEVWEKDLRWVFTAM